MEPRENVRVGKSGVGDLMKKFQNSNFKIQNLKIQVGDKEIIRGVTMEIKPGEIHALMGPNGSGKSSLALALAGHPNYKIKEGKILLGKKDLTLLKPEERAGAGLFLAFQYPFGVEGVSLFNFLKAVENARGKKVPPAKLLANLKTLSAEVGLEEGFLRRDLNLDFSGGEKKRAEVLQALALEPEFSIFDEIDSGLDVDALKLISNKIYALAKKGTGILVITHYQRILSTLKPDFVHVLIDGQIARSGGPKLAQQLEKTGYKNL